MTDDPHSVSEQHRWVLDLDMSKAGDEGVGGAGAAVRPDALAAAAAAAGGRPAKPALAQMLAKVPLFRRLHPPQLKKMLQMCQPVSFAQGERVCALGDDSDRVLILFKGRLAVSLEDGVRVATVEPVTTIGEMGFVTRWQRTVNLDALEPCSMMAIPNAQLQAVLQADDDLHLRMLQNIVAIMAARIVGLNAHMRDHLRQRRSS